MFSNTRRLAFSYRQPMKQNTLEVLERSICVQLGLSVLTKVLICKKAEDEPAYCPFRYEQLFDLMQIMLLA